MATQRKPLEVSDFRNTEKFGHSGLTAEMLAEAINFTHETIDDLDQTMMSSGLVKMSQMVELANLSSMLGNILGTGVAKASNEIRYSENPHHRTLTFRVSLGGLQVG